MDFDSAKPKVGSGDSKKLEDLLPLLKLPDNKWVQLRVMPYSIAALKQHWIDIVGSKSGREVRIPKMCVSFDPNNEDVSRKGIKCPYCEIDSKTQPFYLIQVLVRSEQEDKPSKTRMTSSEKKTGIKDPNSDSWTPVRVLRCPASLMLKIQGLKDLNTRKAEGKKKAYSVADPKYGMDINVKYSSKASGTDKYQVQVTTENEPLSKEELAYLHYEFDAEELMKEMGLETAKEAAEEVKRMEIVGSKEFDGSGDDRKSKSKSKGKSGKASSYDASSGDSLGSSGDSSDDSGDKRSSKKGRNSKAKDDSSGDSGSGSGDSDNDSSADRSGSSGDDSDDSSEDSKKSKSRGKGSSDDDSSSGSGDKSGDSDGDSSSGDSRKGKKRKDESSDDRDDSSSGDVRSAMSDDDSSGDGKKGSSGDSDDDSSGDKKSSRSSKSSSSKSSSSSSSKKSSSSRRK